MYVYGSVVFCFILINFNFFPSISYKYEYILPVHSFKIILWQ